jgi:hypothetical protein
MQDRPPDPYVREHLSVAGSEVGQSLAGLWGDSDRPGCRRLYLTTKLDYFVEFRVDDVLAVASVPPEAAPFVGLDATRVTLAQDAAIDWVRRQVGRTDPFLLEASNAIVQPPELTTWGADCPAVTHRFGESDFFQCDPGGGHPGGGTGTFGPWPTQGGHTCATCNQETCVTCDQTTCVTCATCACLSVVGTCGRATCRGCTQDCGPYGGWGASAGATCDRTCASCNGTCDASCGGTCRQTCDTTCATTCQESCMDTCFTCAGTCQATCETCWTCTPTCGHCETNPGWCLIRA